MKYSTATILLAYFGITSAVPYQKREVPQEHSHQEVLDKVDVSLKLNNPNNIQGSVFGLLGDAAAIKGAGDIKNLDCLQRSIADQAFTNEKKAGNVDGMANALIFAALEKNTGAVGKASNTCTDKAVNPEIDAISQHQDPAGAGAQAANKKIVLTLAVQLESIGADPQLASTSATFAPGEANDPTGAGNTCDDQDDKKGCIFTKKLIQVEATPEEIDAAVKAGGATGASSAADSTGNKSGGSADKVKASSKNVGAEEDADAADAADAADEKAIGKNGKDAVKGKSSGKDAEAEDNAGAAEAAEATAAGDAGEEKASGKDGKDAVKGKSSGKDAEAEDDAGAAKATAAGDEGNFGTCGNPAIQFAEGLDNRKEASFQAVNQKDFNHGSALNIKVISDFICQKLQDSCKAPADVVEKCNKASTAAQTKKGQESADAFNSGLSV